MEIATRTERWRGRLQGNLYQEQEKWHSSAAREANPSSTGTGTSGIPHCCWQATALQLHFLIAGAWVSVPSLPLPKPWLVLLPPAALRTSICCATMSCAWDLSSPCLALLRLLLQLRLLWRQRRRVWFIKCAARTWQKTAKSRNSKSANHFRLKNCEKVISIWQAAGPGSGTATRTQHVYDLKFIASDTDPVEAAVREFRFKLNESKSCIDITKLLRIMLWLEIDSALSCCVHDASSSIAIKHRNQVARGQEHF